MMDEKTFLTSHGVIHYWVSKVDASPLALVFLPGLIADHRLFDKQIEHFEGRCNLFVWDAPGHAASWPFELTFSLADKARWLHDILECEGFTRPLIVGQSMGGYLGQMFIELFPGEAAGFISIDSGPLQRKYLTAAELWMLKHTEGVYRHYPWKSLVKAGSDGVVTTEYGRAHAGHDDDLRRRSGPLRRARRSWLSHGCGSL